MYPLALLKRPLHSKWQSFLLNKTWKTQHRKVKGFFLKCDSLGDSNGYLYGRSFLPIHTFTNTWVMTRDWLASGWGWKGSFKAIGRNYVTSCHCHFNAKMPVGSVWGMATTNSKHIQTGHSYSLTRHMPCIRE